MYNSGRIGLGTQERALLHNSFIIGGYRGAGKGAIKEALPPPAFDSLPLTCFQFLNT